MPGEAELLAAGRTLEPAQRALLDDLVAFVGQRLAGARAARDRIRQAAAQPMGAESLQVELHVLLRECWDALDGLGRLANLCLHRLFPGAGLRDPERATRQCTLYTVRRDLGRHPEAARHPLSVLLATETRAQPHRAYARLSFLYNLSLFVPVPLPDGSRLPGSSDVPSHLRGLVKPQQVEGCPLEAGLGEMLDWLTAFTERCYGLMAQSLSAQGAR